MIPLYVTISRGEALDGGVLSSRAALAISVSGKVGPPGPPGSGAGSSYHYAHTQSTPAAEWTIAHGGDTFPSVTVVDSDGKVIEGEVEYLDSNSVRVTFTAAFSGKAYLN